MISRAWSRSLYVQMHPARAISVWRRAPLLIAESSLGSRVHGHEAFSPGVGVLGHCGAALARWLTEQTSGVGGWGLGRGQMTLVVVGAGGRSAAQVSPPSAASVRSAQHAFDSAFPGDALNVVRCTRRKCWMPRVSALVWFWNGCGCGRRSMQSLWILRPRQLRVRPRLGTFILPDAPSALQSSPRTPPAPGALVVLARRPRTSPLTVADAPHPRGNSGVCAAHAAPAPPLPTPALPAWPPPLGWTCLR